MTAALEHPCHFGKLCPWMALERPNVLLITSHDVGPHLGCYGVPTVHTPNLDRLSAEGVRFTNTFCSAPQCSPSRASIATGRYPHSNGVMGLCHGLFRFDLHPGERHLARLPEGASVRKELLSTLHAWMRETRDPLLEGVPPSPMHHMALTSLSTGEVCEET